MVAQNYDAWYSQLCNNIFDRAGLTFFQVGFEDYRRFLRPLYEKAGDSYNDLAELYRQFADTIIPIYSLKDHRSTNGFKLFYAQYWKKIKEQQEDEESNEQRMEDSLDEESEQDERRPESSKSRKNAYKYDCTVEEYRLILGNLAVIYFSLGYDRQGIPEGVFSKDQEDLIKRGKEAMASKRTFLSDIRKSDDLTKLSVDQLVKMIQELREVNKALRALNKRQSEEIKELTAKCQQLTTDLEKARAQAEKPEACDILDLCNRHTEEMNILIDELQQAQAVAAEADRQKLRTLDQLQSAKEENQSLREQLEQVTKARNELLGRLNEISQIRQMVEELRNNGLFQQPAISTIFRETNSDGGITPIVTIRETSGTGLPSTREIEINPALIPGFSQ